MTLENLTIISILYETLVEVSNSSMNLLHFILLLYNIVAAIKGKPKDDFTIPSTTRLTLKVRSEVCIFFSGIGIYFNYLKIWFLQIWIDRIGFVGLIGYIWLDIF